jgi:hypothetical protein
MSLVESGDRTEPLAEQVHDQINGESEHSEGTPTQDAEAILFRWSSHAGVGTSLQQEVSVKLGGYPERFLGSPLNGEPRNR